MKTGCLSAQVPLLEKSIRKSGSSILSFGLAFVIAGCLETDPYANKRETIRQAQVPGSSKVSSVVDPLTLRIDSSVESPVVVEGEPLSLTLTGRILKGDINRGKRVTIGNMEDFPGATFDDGTGAFNWTPPLGFVSTDSEKRVLRVQLTADASADEPVILTNSREIPVQIERLKTFPEFVDMNGVKNNTTIAQSTRENSTVPVVLRIRDRSSIKEGPFLKVIIQGTTPDSRPWVSFQQQSLVPEKDSADKSIWIFRGELQVGKIPDDKRIADVEARFYAMNAYGLQSKEALMVKLTVEPNIPDPILNMTKRTLSAAPGTLVKEQFLFLSPNPTMRLDMPVLTFQSTMTPAEAPIWTCAYGREDSRVLGHVVACELTWQVPELTEARGFPLLFRARNYRGYGGSEYKEKTFEFSIEVQP